VNQERVAGISHNFRIYSFPAACILFPARIRSSSRNSLPLAPLDQRFGIRLTAELLAGCFRFVPVMLHVQLGSFLGVVRGMVQVALRGVRVVSRLVMVAGFMVPCRFAVVPSRVIVVLCCFVMMFCCLLGHKSSSST
jgi:hypothetical protein